MATNYMTENPRRSSRGGRRRPRRRSNNRLNEGSFRDSSKNQPISGSPKKLTFWQKIVAFFTRSEAEPIRTRKGHPTKSEKVTRVPRTGMRKPELVDVTTPRLYIGNLSFDAVESDLFELFNGVGVVQNVEVVSNRQTHRSKGFAFVQMRTVDEAKRAVAELHDKEYMGRKLVVSGAKAMTERRENPDERIDQSKQ